MLNKNVFIASVFKAIGVSARIAKNSSENMVMKSVVAYTWPDQIPGGKGCFSLVVVLDTTSNIQEVSPQVIIGNSQKELIDMIEAQATYSRKIYQVNQDTIHKFTVLYYGAMTGEALQTVSQIDVQSATRTIGEIISRDCDEVIRYVTGVQGDRSRINFEPLVVNTQAGRLIKDSNNFMFEDGLIITVTGVSRNPDGSFGVGYDVYLNDSIMRSVKEDAGFSALGGKPNTAGMTNNPNDIMNGNNGNNGNGFPNPGSYGYGNNGGRDW